MSRKDETSTVFSRIPIVPLALLLIGACVTSKADAGPGYIDLELVLAVDASDSMSRTEKLVQRYGYIAALRSAEVAAAITARGALALSYVEWAGPHEQRIVVPWSILADAEDANRFADALAVAPLSPGFVSPPWETGTSISQALLFATGMFSAPSGTQQIIDISGDGTNNSGDALSTAREHVVAAGITINGLPVITRGGRSDAPLGAYYADCVIGGPGAFVMTVDDPSLFALAIRRKLVLEIAGPPARLMHADYRTNVGAATDCGDIGPRTSR